MERSITFITNYYPPETGAAANRIALLAENFAKAGYKTHVLCPLPNYPTGTIFEAYKGQSGVSETINNVTVTRLWVYATNSPSKWKRLLSMVSFSISIARYAIRSSPRGLVFIQCSPLLVGYFGTLFFKGKHRKIVLNVSDLWPLAGKELGKLKEGFSYNLLERLERYNYRKAAIVLGQSEEIITHVKELYPEKETFLYRNFPDFPAPSGLETKNLNTKKMVYAGLLGVAQGIFELCEKIQLPDGWEFHIYGDGAQRTLIENYLKTSSKRIVYCGSLSRKQLHQELLSYDITIIPLVKRIYGSVPSKIFEYGRLGIPLLFFGGGEGEILVQKNTLGWVVPAGDYSALNEQLQALPGAIWPSKEDIQKTSVHNFDAQLQFEKLLHRLD